MARRLADGRGVGEDSAWLVAVLNPVSPCRHPQTHPVDRSSSGKSASRTTQSAIRPRSPAAPVGARRATGGGGLPGLRPRATSNLTIDTVRRGRAKEA